MRKIASYLRVYLLDALTYRGDIFLYTLGGIAQPLINIFIWIAITDRSTAPLSQSEFIQYFLLVMLIGTWTSSWAGKFISSDIRLGKISSVLLKPVSFHYNLLGNNLGEKIIKTIYLFPAILIIGIGFGVNIPKVGITQSVLLVPALIQATVILFVSDLCLGFGAFWIDDNSALFEFFSVSMFFFSGRFIPLIAFPQIIQQVGQFLPFRYTLSFPIEILLNQLSTHEIIKGLIMQSLWLLIIVEVYKLLWNRGIKRYSAFGA